MSDSTTNESAPAYWIFVGSPDNFARTAELGFMVQGMKSRHRKKAERMAPGDKLVWYITGQKAFAGYATITSRYFESHERVWSSSDPNKAAEDYPYRVEIRPEVVLPQGEYLPAEGVARQMAYVAKWPAANWTLAFQGNVHVISEGDFNLIREAIEARAPVAATPVGFEALSGVAGS